ncbi:hypothetical protein [Plantibacter sp. YIM 135249]|uniref:hypothetical protein n=1 Tax=Plantibacter sp. YIM 135249 TaxID=3423918 RepID=UPI003D33F7EA
MESLLDKLSVSLHKELLDAASDRATRDEVVRLINTEHFICSLCIGYLRLVDLGQDLVQLACEKIVDVALDAALPEDTDVLVRTATSKVLSKSLLAAFPIPGNPAETAAVQFLALITCPEWSAHPDNAVVKECVTPHFAAAFSEIELDWIENGIPGPVPR